MKDANHIYQSQEILDGVRDETGILEHAWENGTIKYQLTKDELYWLHTVHDKYHVPEYLFMNMLSKDDKFAGIVTLVQPSMSTALDDDCKGAGKAVMLSDDTALQAIFFYGYQEFMEDMEEIAQLVLL